MAGWQVNVEEQRKKDLKLVVFDVDGTLVKGYSWEFMHEALGTGDDVRHCFDLFLKGSLSYEEWARIDASLWRGLPLERAEQIIRAMPYVTGARETIPILRNKVFRVFLLSAGLSLVSERINAEIGVDGYLANELLVQDGFLTGEVKVNVSFHRKDEALGRILREWNLEMENCVAVGDDPTLVPLFKKVGLSIAFNPVNERIEKAADFVVKRDDLQLILPYILDNRT